MFATLAYEGRRPELEDSLAQGFKADAMRHAGDPQGAFKGSGWVAGNRLLVADVGLPHAESWYARTLLYQALALYAISGADREDTLDLLAYRLHAFVWSDEIEDAGGLPTVLSRKTAQLVGDVAILIDLKEGSPDGRHEGFATEHRGLSRGFRRTERRLAKPGTRAPTWQRKISSRRMRELWEQMEYKARR
jgi:hypothetical protein